MGISMKGLKKAGGKILNTAKKVVTSDPIISATSAAIKGKDPVKAGVDAVFESPVVKPLVKSVGGLGPAPKSKAGEYLKKVNTDAANKAKAQENLDKFGGFSPFIDQSSEYVKRFGAGEDTVRAILADSYTQAFDPLAQQFGQLANASQIQTNIDPAFRQYQMGLAQQLQQQAMGQGPSLAQLQLQQATDRTLNQSLGAIRAATGPNAALAGRTAALAASQQLGGAGNASAQLRLQEQQQAQQQLAGLSTQGRTADIAGEQLRTQTELSGRDQQLAALQAQQGAVRQSLSGKDAALSGVLGIASDRAAADRINDAAATKDRRDMQNNILGSVVTGIAAGISSKGK